MSATRLMLFDRAGAALAEMEADLQSVSWRLGEVGMARFNVAYTNPKATPFNLQPGNRVLMRFENGLPDWGGVLDFPIGRSASGLSVSAYEGGRLLDWRLSGIDANFATMAPGEIAQALLEQANSVYPTGIELVHAYNGGSQSREYHHAGLLQTIRALALESGYDYAVTPVYANGHLYLDLFWYERQGDDRRARVALVQGHNVGEVTLDEQGPVTNVVYVVGKGNDWSSRPVATGQVAASIALYGRREAARMYLDVSDADTLQAIADSLAEELAYPRARATLSGVTDRDPGRLADYGVGDIVSLQAFQNAGEWAFDDVVRVIAREWQPAAGTCTVEVEQWRSA